MGQMVRCGASHEKGAAEERREHSEEQPAEKSSQEAGVVAGRLLDAFGTIFIGTGIERHVSGHGRSFSRNR